MRLCSYAAYGCQAGDDLRESSGLQTYSASPHLHRGLRSAEERAREALAGGQVTGYLDAATQDTGGDVLVTSDQLQ
jgi:hypothetical protein